MTATARDTWFRKNKRQIVQIQIDPKSKELDEIIRTILSATVAIAESIPDACIESIDAESDRKTIKIQLDNSKPLIQYRARTNTINYETRVVN